MSSKLFGEDDSDSEIELKTDTDFAKSYNTWRQKEELNRLKTKYQHDEDGDSSSSSSEDEEVVELDDKFEKDFLKTLSCLKNKDPRIYNKDFEFFDKSNTTATPKEPKKKNQPMYVKDYERNLILEKGGQLSDDEEETSTNMSKTYVQEQDEIKENFKKALKDIEGEEDEEDWGGMFKTRQRTKEEEAKEEHDYMQWLAGQKEHMEDRETESELKPLKEFWTDPKLDEGEKFLRDYLLKKKFLDTENDNYIPTYDEVIHDSDKDLSEDEKAINTQEEFEYKYNFRFEEPDTEFIKRYPRTMENSLRQKDDKRKVKRQERKERKLNEKKEKMEEIERLKVLKKAEIEDKIKKLQEITGNKEMAFDVKDFDDDFNPEEHDRRMQNLFNDEFYKESEGEQKPEFPELDQELQLENWDRWHGEDQTENPEASANQNEYEPHCEDDDFNMDCDYDPASTQQELIDNVKGKKKRRRKSKFAEVLAQPKPVFNPTDKNYEEYLDEYYKLDCEDIIGDVPCRFKYRKVVPNSFGLSIEEILTAKDKELNRWCSLKKAIQHRPEHVEKYDVIAFERKGKNINLKKKYLPSLFIEEATDGNIIPDTSNTQEQPADNRKRKNSETQDREAKAPATNINKNNERNGTSTETDSIAPETSSEPAKKRRKRKQNQETSVRDKEASEPVPKKRNKSKDVGTPGNTAGDDEAVNVKKSNKNAAVVKKQKSSKKHKGSKAKKNSATKSQADIGISDARLQAYGFNPKKFKNKLKYSGAM